MFYLAKPKPLRKQAKDFINKGYKDFRFRESWTMVSVIHYCGQHTAYDIELAHDSVWRCWKCREPLPKTIINKLRSLI